MEARSVDEIPVGDDWQYEPKWDGFRCVAFRNGKDVFLQSKAGQPLARYFPDVVAQLQALQAKRFVLDGELVIPVGHALSFDELQLRLHPAASRVQKLAAAHPALLIVFDLLADTTGKSLLESPLRGRRKKLEAFARENFISKSGLRLSPATTKLTTAKKWLDKTGGNLDGVMAKEIDSAYASGERTAMVKVKQIRSVDCVVGGFRYATGSRLLGSLLLGLYDDDGLLHHVGFTSAFKKTDLPALTKKFQALKKKPGFTGNAPAVRAVGARNGAPNGNPSIRRRSWKSPTITLPAAVFVTEQRSCAGAAIRRRVNAPWTRWSIAKEDRSRCYR